MGRLWGWHGRSVDARDIAPASHASGAPTRFRSGGRASALLLCLFAASGASVLLAEVAWHRILSLQLGVDQVALTATVTAILIGLGVGGMVGGFIADRLRPAECLRAFGVATGLFGLVTLFSPELLDVVVGSVAERITSGIAKFGVNVAVLLVPAFLQGVGLPLLIRAVPSSREAVGPRVGGLVGINAIGSAVGAIVGGWVLVGTFGYEACARSAGILALLVALGGLAYVRRTPSQDEGFNARSEDTPSTYGGSGGSKGSVDVRRWYLLTAMTGAIALGFQQVFFRVVDSIMRSNSYSFPFVLAIYIGSWGVGALIGGARVRRSRDPAATFRRLQFLVAASAGSSLLLVIEVLPRTLLSNGSEVWYNGDGLAPGLGEVSAGVALIYAGILPIVLMCLPCLAMGASYPFAQAAISTSFEQAGRRTGGLAAANIFGSAAGSLVVGLLLIDQLGSAGTYRVLVGATAVLLVAAASLTVTEPRRPHWASVALVAPLVLLVLVMPSNQRLWSVIVGFAESSTLVDEDSSCSTAIKHFGETGGQLVINGASQNGYPFDDFHVLIGLLPGLTRERTERALSIGFGVGSTTFGLLADDSVQAVDTVELCGGNVRLARRLTSESLEGTAELEATMSDERARFIHGDGRRFLVENPSPYDVIVVDTLRPTSANSGSHFSVEFYELIRSRLRAGGVFAEWVPSGRVLNSVTTVFPYVETLTVRSYNDSMLLLASTEPINVSADVERRLGERTALLSDARRASFLELLEEIEPRCAASGAVADDVPPELVNRDLLPRDEFFLNNPSVAIDDEECVGG